MKKYLSGFLVFLMVFGMFSFNVGRVSAAASFSDSFGENSLGTDGDDINWNSWSNGGNNGHNEDDAELRVSSGSGNDSASPDGGRFAILFGKDGYICRTIDTTGFTNVKLSYNWRGDSDAEGSDDGIVEYKDNGTSCTSNAFTQLKSHDLSQDGSWSTQSAFDLPNDLDNTTFKLRFRVDSSSDDEHFRVDGINITGDAIVVKTNPTLSVSNSPVTYNGSAQSATVAGSVAGVVSDIKYDGSSTAPTNAGTYAVTADFVPTDTVNYNNLSDASAGNFVIEKANPTIVVTPYSVVFDESPHTATGTAKGVMDEDLAGLDLSGTTHTAVGTYNDDPWTFTDVTGNYNNANGSVTDVISASEEPICEDTDVSTTFISDAEATYSGESLAQAVTPHPAWLASIPGATWIYDAVLNELGSSATGDRTFTKSFTVVGTPLDSTLEIAADNMYTVSVNGNPLTTGTSATDIDNFGSADMWTIPSSMLVTGSNTLSVTVTNPAVNPNNSEEVYGDPNPAGLLFKITVHQNECIVPEDPEPEPTYVKVHLYKHLVNGESTSQVADNSGLTPFPMTATWDASNIGSGTGNYVLGNQHGGAAFVYAADTSAMLAPVTSYTSFERTGVSEEGVANVIPVGGECVANQYRLVGYKSGTTLGAAQNASVSTTAPVFTNFSTDQHVIVVNEDCDDVIVVDDNDDEEENDDEDEDNEENQTTGTLIVRKLVVNDEGGVKGATDFSFNINGGEPIQFIDSPDENSMTGENQITLSPGTYTVTENLMDGYYKVSEEGCSSVSIAVGETKICSFVNYDYIVSTGGSGGGTGLGGGTPAGEVAGASTENPSGNSTPVGQVLGAETCNTEYLTSYIFFGRKNDKEQVKKLQIFLNEELGLSLPVDGIYGKVTRDAVKAFQVKYLADVLNPWKKFGLKDEKGTGNVYKTTKHKINMIKCEALNLPTPQLP